MLADRVMCVEGMTYLQSFDASRLSKYCVRLSTLLPNWRNTKGHGYIDKNNYYIFITHYFIDNRSSKLEMCLPKICVVLGTVLITEVGNVCLCCE